MVGQKAAEESIDEIRSPRGAEWLFITLGAVAALVAVAGTLVARAARSRVILVVGFATKAFRFRGRETSQEC